MRIIAGIARGMVLRVPRGSNTRPTSDRVREAVFSSLGERVAAARVLDLFAGTGALGLEALSRGAAAATFVEQAPPALGALRANLEEYRIRDLRPAGLTVHAKEAFWILQHLLTNQEQFDLVFADPPYGALGQRLVEDQQLPSLLTPGGLVVLETAARNSLSVPVRWQKLREATYGDTQVVFLVLA